MLLYRAVLPVLHCTLIAAHADALSLLSSSLSFLSGGMALRQRHPLTIAILKMCFDGILRGLWQPSEVATLIPHLVLTQPCVVRTRRTRVSP